jgi:NADH-quinone oxidoreductase subunit F
MPRINSASELEELRKGVLSERDPDKPSIAICAGMGCHSLGNGRIISAIEEEINKKDLRTNVDIRATGCHGYCEKGPMVVVYPEEICYVEVTPKDVPEIISQTVLGKKVIDHLIYSDPDTGEKAAHQSGTFSAITRRSIPGASMTTWLLVVIPLYPNRFLR